MTDCYVTDIHICARDLQSAWWAPIGTLNFPFRFIKRINCSVQSQAMSDVCYIISFSSINNSIIVVIIIIDRISKLCIFTTILTSIIYLVYAVQQWYHYKQLALILSGIFSQQVSVSVVDWWRVELRVKLSMQGELWCESVARKGKKRMEFWIIPRNISNTNFLTVVTGHTAHLTSALMENFPLKAELRERERQRQRYVWLSFPQPWYLWWLVTVTYRNCRLACLLLSLEIRYFTTPRIWKLALTVRSHKKKKDIPCEEFQESTMTDLNYWTNFQN